MLLRWVDELRHRARLKRWNTAHAWGRRAEDLAHRYLQARGYTVVSRNYQARSGIAELDLVARDGSTLVFVEVKSRWREDFGAPESAVDETKREHLIRAATEYIKRIDWPWNSVRFDIVSVVFGESPKVTHIEDAFQLHRG